MKQLYCDCCGKWIPSLYDSFSCGPYEMCGPCRRIWREVAEQTYSVLLRETQRRKEMRDLIGCAKGGGSQ